MKTSNKIALGTLLLGFFLTFIGCFVRLNKGNGSGSDIMAIALILYIFSIGMLIVNNRRKIFSFLS